MLDGPGGVLEDVASGCGVSDNVTGVTERTRIP